MFTITKESLDLLRKISDDIQGSTFHHHYHILYDIACSFKSTEHLNYLEIGCYAGASACLLLQRPMTDVYSIDLGTPIVPELAKQNVNRQNRLLNRFTYIEGDSHSTATFDQVKNLKFNILFIDGDHRYNGVIQDWQMYSDLVSPGGYIVFDDYNDYIASPEVKLAIDFIVQKLDKEEYKVIGTIQNQFSARGFPDSFTDGNCFIIRKLK